MKNFIIVITIIIALASCRSPQQIADRKCAKAKQAYELASYKWGCPMAIESNEQKDSIVTIIKDTTIYVPVPGDSKTDTVEVTLHDGIVNSVQLRKDTEYAYATAQVINGFLVLNLYQKESKIAATLKGAIRIEYRYVNKTKTITITNTTNQLNQWQILQLWAGRIAILWLIVGFSICLLRKRLI